MTLCIPFLLWFPVLAFVTLAQSKQAESNHTSSSSSSAQPHPVQTFQQIIAESLQQPFPGPNGVPSKFVSDILRIAGPSDEWPDLICAGGDIQNCPVRKNFPGPSSRSPVRWAHVRYLASLLPSRQWEGKWWRGSELGEYITAPLYYTEPGTGRPILQPMAIGTGSLPKQHAVVRPPIELAMDLNRKSPSEVRQIKRFIRSSLRDALEHGKKKGTFVRDDIGAWFQQTLNYVLLHRNVSREYAETLYGLITPLITSFAFSNAIPRHLWPLDPLGMQRIKAAMHTYMEEFKPLVRKHYGHLIEGCDCSPSRSCLEQVTYSFLDTFLQAGGISIPSSIFTGLGVLYSTDPSNPAGSAGFEYKKSEAASVFWEVVRLFTPVRSLAYWGRRPLCAGLTRKQTDGLNKPDGKTEACPLSDIDPVTGYPPVNQYKGGYRTLINLAIAMNDPAIWGRDANKFRPRPLKDYRKYSVAFAEPAMDNSVANGTMNRDCPARSMALFIGKTFFEIFNKNDWFTDPKTPIKLKSGGGADAVFTLYYRYNETNCKNILCNCSPKGSDNELCGSEERQCEECLKGNDYCRF